MTAHDAKLDVITANRWRNLTYHEPAETLRQLRSVEREVDDQLRGADLDASAREALSLRGDRELNKYREWRDAALFTYGMGLATRTKLGFATLEDDDYDFVTAWVDGDTAHFCPVQLKELPPEERNARQTVERILLGLSKKYAPTTTVLAVRLSRAGRLILDRAWPAVPFAQLWFFWASAPNSAEWSIYGDALGTPCQWAFDYPT